MSKQGPRDLNEVAYRVVNDATGQTSPKIKKEKNAAAVELGRMGGLKGGKARMESMTPERRSEIARKAAKARWSVKSDGENNG